MRGLILGLPRSRTAWLSAYFSIVNQDGTTTHEAIATEFNQRPARYEEAAADWRSWVDCTTYWPAAGLIPRDTPVIFIERPIAFSLVSLMRVPGVYVPTKQEMVLANESCRAAAQVVVRFDDLDEQLPLICLAFGLPYDTAAHERLERLKITTKRTSL